MLGMALASCATQPQFTRHPLPLLGHEKPPADMAIVLIGIVGPRKLDYMGLNHFRLPTIRAGFQPTTDAIVAFPIPVGIKGLNVNEFTAAGSRVGNIGSMSYGYVGVHSNRVDIDTPGIYFLTTVDSSRPESFDKTPLPSQLRDARRRLAVSLEGREPVNFTWPAD
jgi:hypothetical protein